MVNGETFNVNSDPYEGTTQAPLWDKRDRSNLTPEEKQLFVKNATMCILSKSNKLALPSYKQNEDGTLRGLQNTTSQLKSLETHIIRYGMRDVFTTVQPKSLMTSIDSYNETFNLFLDYPRLNTSFVANSNAWWRRYISQASPWINENFQYSFDFIKANTTETLFDKAFQDYLEFPDCQKGGPLILLLILQRIQNTSETSLDNLRTSLRNLKISMLEGEDVELATNIIKSSVAALKGASRPEKSFLPDDLSELILKIYQTTSVASFNLIFAEERKRIFVEADKANLLPVWPSTKEITSLAIRSYLRMMADGTWTAPAPKKAAFPAVIGERPPPTCFNCGEVGHLAPDCPHERNEAKFKANAEAHRAKRAATAGFRGGGRGRGRGGRSGRGHDGGRGRGSGRGRGRSDHTRTTKVIDGQPHVLNKKGAYVLDHKALQAKRDDEKFKAVTEWTISTFGTPPTTVQAPSGAGSVSGFTAASSISGTTSVRTYTPDQIRAALIARRNDLHL